MSDIRPKDDHYPTPPEATRALLSVEAFPGGIWEPAAGHGDMAAALREAGITVRATTLLDGRHDRAFPKHRVQGGIDFLETIEVSHPNIVTNPPYKIAEAFVRHAIGLGPAKVAMLLNIKFLGAVSRKDGLFAEYPPARLHVFSDRITMYPAGYEGKRGTTTETMAWFIWEWPFRKVEPRIASWLDSKQHQEAAE